MPENARRVTDADHDPLLRVHHFLTGHAFATGIPSVITGWVAAPLAAGLAASVVAVHLGGSQLLAAALIAAGAVAVLLNVALTFEPPPRR